MKKTALVTGASSGIGRELARIHASKGGDVIVVARREEKLKALKAELETTHGVSVTVIVADLSVSGIADDIYREVKAHNLDVEYLINNAGFGGHGTFHEGEWTRYERMIGVNVTALSALTHVFLQDMVARNSGRILNVASTAAMVPGPLQAVYYATKAYVLSFSQAIAEELSDTNVTVTALCPGPTDTGFVEAGDLEGAELFKREAASPREVAQTGYDAMMNGTLVEINETLLKILLDWVVPFAPRKAVLKMSRQSMEKK